MIMLLCFHFADAITMMLRGLHKPSEKKRQEEPTMKRELRYELMGEDE